MRWTGRPAVRRAGAAAVLLVAAVGVLTGSGLDSLPLKLSDGTAWLVRGDGMVRGEASTGEADWLHAGVFDGEAAGAARVAQDDEGALVVDPTEERLFSIDAVTLELSDPVEVEETAVPHIGGGQAYLVSEGTITWLDPETFEAKATIRLPGHAEAVIDGDGLLWVVTSRDGMLRRISRGEITVEAPVASPGHALAITLAGNRPVVLDRDAAELWFVDRRSGGTDGPVTIPEGATLQGPSSFGSRVWVSADDTVVGVAPDGDTLEAALPTGPLQRPEVVADRVVVPAGDGTVVVLDETTGEAVTDAPVALPAATEADFHTFVQDGVVWFTAPEAELAGTVAPDGSVAPLEVDEEALRAQQEANASPETPTPDDPPDAPPDRPATPPPGDTPSVPSPTPGAPPTTLPPPPATPPPTSRPAPPQPTTTRHATTTTAGTVAVPNLVDQGVDAACTALQQARLSCTRQPTGQYNTPAQMVLAQNPAPGAAVAPGTPVVVSYHETEGIAVPTAGRRRASACDPITAAGLTCNLVPRPSPTDMVPEEVYGQTPAPGTRVGPGSTVNVTYESRAWGTLWRLDDPNSYKLELTTDAGRARDLEAFGFSRTTLGAVFLEPAPWTQPIQCWEPNGAGSNESRVYTIDPTFGSPYHQRCGTLGYILQGGYSRTISVYHFIGFSDEYYSTDPNDPVGMSYRNRDPEGFYTGWIFEIFEL